jgi:hypothetical protein
MNSDLSPQLQEILAKFGQELQAYIREEVRKAIAEQQIDPNLESAQPQAEPAVTENFGNADAIDPVASYEPPTEAAGMNSASDTIPSVAPTNNDSASANTAINWAGMTDYDKMYSLLNRVKAKAQGK